MYIIIGILAFGLLIALHELGHFIAAKACGVKVNEYSIGMGPALWKRQYGETLYALRALPIGGYCAMEGEDGAEEGGEADPRAFFNRPWWQKAVILVAGPAMNFLIGVLIVGVIYSSAQAFVTNEVVETVDGFLYAENGIEAGDKIWSIDGHRIYSSSDFSIYMQRAGQTVDMVVVRDGEKILLQDYGLKPAQYADGFRYGVTFGTAEATPPVKLQYTLYTSVNFVRSVWMGLTDLVTGAVGLKDMSGAVGIMGIINETGREAEEQTNSKAAALEQVFYLIALIAVNLAVMNLLPIPALDGGRLLFVFLNAIAMLLFRRQIDPKYEGWVHAAGMVALLGLTAVIMISDVMKYVR